MKGHNKPRGVAVSMSVVQTEDTGANPVGLIKAKQRKITNYPYRSGDDIIKK